MKTIITNASRKAVNAAKGVAGKVQDKASSLNNRVFSSDVLQNEHLNYIVGAVVAVLCVAIVQGHVSVPAVMNTSTAKLVQLLVIVLVARHNLVLALILLAGHMIVSQYASAEEPEQQ